MDKTRIRSLQEMTQTQIVISQEALHQTLALYKKSTWLIIALKRQLDEKQNKNYPPLSTKIWLASRASVAFEYNPGPDIAGRGLHPAGGSSYWVKQF